MTFLLFDLLTWPLIFLGLIRGSYTTYKYFNRDWTNSVKQEKLQYWVVFSAIIFVFPLFETILGWFFFGGFIRIIRITLLIMIVVSRSKCGFLYKLLEEQFFSFVEPCMKVILKFSAGFRTQSCDSISFYLTSVYQSLIGLLVYEMSNKNCELLTKNLNYLIQILNTQERTNFSHEDDSNMKTSTDTTKSIDEKTFNKYQFGAKKFFATK